MSLALLASTSLITSSSALADGKHHGHKHHKHHKHHPVEAPREAPCADPCSRTSTPSTGIYLGGQVGQQKIAYRASATNQFGSVDQTQNLFGLNDRAFVGGVMLGYGLELWRLYWGLETEVLFGNTKAKAHYDITPNPAVNGGTRVYVKTGTTWGAAFRVGKACGGALFYARFGIEGRQFKLTMDPNNDTIPIANKIINAKKREVAFVPGIGFEMHVVKGLSVRFEAREAFYDGFAKNSASNAPIAIGGSRLKLKRISSSTVLLGVTWKTGLLERKI